MEFGNNNTQVQCFQGQVPNSTFPVENKKLFGFLIIQITSHPRDCCSLFLIAQTDITF